MRTASLLALLTLIVAAGIGYVAWSSGLVDLYRLWQDTAEVPFNPAECRLIAAEIMAGQLVPDAAGLVKLPSSLSNATKFGRVYVTRKRGGLLLILFPTWRGRHSTLAGYLYCSRPLTKADPPLDRYARTHQEVEVIGPVLSHFSKKNAGLLGVTVQRKVKPQWYYVDYELD